MGGSSQPGVEPVDTGSLGLPPEQLGGLPPRREAGVWDGTKTGSQARGLSPSQEEPGHVPMLRGGGRKGRGPEPWEGAGSKGSPGASRVETKGRLTCW